MELSIIIVNWNSKDYLARAVAAVEATLGAVDYEIVVIDSGSFDGSAEMLGREHPDVRFIQSASNLGFARANNEAARRSRRRGPPLPQSGHRGPRPRRSSSLLNALRSLPDAGIVGPKLLNTDGTVQDTCIRAFPTIANQLLDSDLLRTRFPRARLWGKQPLTLQRGPALSRRRRFRCVPDGASVPFRGDRHVQHRLLHVCRGHGLEHEVAARGTSRVLRAPRHRRPPWRRKQLADAGEQVRSGHARGVAVAVLSQDALTRATQRCTVPRWGWRASCASPCFC